MNVTLASDKGARANRKGAIDPDVESDFVELVTMLRGDRKRA